MPHVANGSTTLSKLTVSFKNTLSSATFNVALLLSAAAILSAAFLLVPPGGDPCEISGGEYHGAGDDPCFPAAHLKKIEETWNTITAATQAKALMKKNCPTAHFQDPDSLATTADVGKHCKA